MAEAIRNHHLREINDEYILLTEYTPLGFEISFVVILNFKQSLENQ